jgi:hypothetical protein
MYGLEAQQLRIHQDGRTETLGDVRGGERTLRHGHQDNISAVATLHDFDLNCGPFLIVYHNYFARNPLPKCVFADANDSQMEKLSHPETNPGKWHQISAVQKANALPGAIPAHGHTGEGDSFPKAQMGQ